LVGDHPLQPPGNYVQQLFADVMSQPVVDRGEAIQIEMDQRDHR
jgi:hypothetical protein